MNGPERKIEKDSHNARATWRFETHQCRVKNPLTLVLCQREKVGCHFWRLL